MQHSMREKEPTIDPSINHEQPEPFAPTQVAPVEEVDEHQERSMVEGANKSETQEHRVRNISDLHKKSVSFRDEAGHRDQDSLVKSMISAKDTSRKLNLSGPWSASEIPAHLYSGMIDLISSEYLKGKETLVLDIKMDNEE